ncbi:Putative lumazine-binding [Chitinophaga jiangningensis]|uniref:Putative lumazine-binding n=1 Tax=Chitinophaga jiangningensis TaxID=1419482 RepID=A0A1M6WKJ9_9BACT|nr:nuclear transport factor 2 family protein [Chitinophaga jiangningensis]SHK94124.1 Putative lumazine-binding [Chitinophaga jiangningensis]
METNNQDKLAITRALKELYLKGIYEGDIALLREVYHPGALLFGDIKGVPYAKTLVEYLDAVMNRVSVKDSGKPFQGDIHTIDVVNSIAVAKLHVKMYDFNYDEFLSFHKIDGKWVIVNKMLTDMAQ